MCTFMEHAHRTPEDHGEEQPLAPWEAAFLANKPVLVIEEPTEWVDRNFPTASWWDKYLLQPGLYVLEPVTLGWKPTDQEHAYYFKVIVKAVRTASYREARLLHHVNADHKEDLNEEATVTLSDYWYRLKQSRPLPSTGKRLARLETIAGCRLEYPAGWEEEEVAAEREADEREASKCDGLPLDQTTCPDKAAHM